MHASPFRAAVPFCAWLLAAAVPAVARADGAFPGSDTIMTPAALPAHIVLATNFGLITSRDDGRTWTWSCEQTLSELATLYQMGPPPTNRIYAVGTNGLVFTDDEGCTWALTQSVPPGTAILDAFPDPSNAARVLAILSRRGDATFTFEVAESGDGGATFERILYSAAVDDQLTGVEIAPSAPAIVYLTMTAGRTFVPNLVRTSDGGETWEAHDLSAGVDPETNQIRLIAVGPDNPDVVYLRLGSRKGEQLGISRDGGRTVTTPLSFEGGVLSAFTQLANGTIVVAGTMGFYPVAFRSHDGGLTFEQLPPAPDFRAFAARGDLLYGVTVYGPTDIVPGRWAIGTSADEGTTWAPLFTYDELRAIEPCIKERCRADCLTRAGLGQWEPAFCEADLGPDGGGGGGGAGAGGAAGGQPPNDGGGGGGGAGGGCGCGSAGAASSGVSAGLLLTALGAWWLGRRRAGARED